jgi:hypothetical protein
MPPFYPAWQAGAPRSRGCPQRVPPSAFLMKGVLPRSQLASSSDIPIVSVSLLLLSLRMSPSSGRAAKLYHASRIAVGPEVHQQ